VIELREALRQTFESIADHPRRVAASAMGVFWGAAAIVLMLSWGGGAADYLMEEFSRYGRPSLFVIPGITSSGFPGYRPGVQVRFSREDALAVERENTELVEAILADHMSQERLLVEARGTVRRLDMTASDERFAYYRRFEIALGRNLTASDVARARPTALLGYEAAEDLFGDVEAAVGSTLRVNGQPFELVGVFAMKIGRQYNNTDRPDNRILVVPSSAAEERLGFDREAVSVATVFVRQDANSSETLAAVRRGLGKRAGFHPDDADALRHFDMANILKQIGYMKVGLTFFIGMAGTITLLIGGIGIANYHLATLAERAVEIAVAKALGARNRTLMLQTVLESVLVSSGAGMSGVALGYAATLAGAQLIPPGLFPAPTISASVAVLALVSLVGVTTIAALIPALRVRQMEITLALREAA
jgi:putative ABC transport system permease protein